MNKGRFHSALLLGLTCLMFCLSSWAHEIRPALLKIKQQGTGQYELEFKQPQVNGRYLNLAVETNCKLQETGSSSGSQNLVTRYLVTCQDDHLRFVTVPGIERTLVDVMVSLTLVNGKQDNHLITANKPVLNLDEASAAVPVYLTLGVEHLVFGYDHVLFVLALLYVVRSRRTLLLVVTTFTVAHSITLALATLGLVTLSQAPVEALIALSIILLAYEALSEQRSLIKTYPWIVAFGFGLLHGLGFAGALANLGLPEGSEILALFLFNVGIELGQLGIVALAISLVFVGNRLMNPLWQRFANLPLYFIGGVASFWFIERSSQIAFS